MRRTTTRILAITVLLISSYALRSQCGGGPCKVCNVTATITNITGGEIVNGTSTITSNIEAGGTGQGGPLEINSTGCGEITITVELDFDWQQGTNINWIHGISFLSSSNWSATSGYVTPFNAGWIFVNSILGKCSGNSYDAGYFWDPVGENCPPEGNRSNWLGGAAGNCNATQRCEANEAYLIDGDPSDNWGVNCTTNCPKFGFTLTYCPLSSGAGTEDITFFITEDGETGGWYNSDGCIFALTFPVTINSSGIPLPEEIGPVCAGTCVTLETGGGCQGYLWSTGQTTSSIEVCPTVTTSYSVTVTGSAGCELVASTTVIVEVCCEPDAGDLSANPNPVCPGETINWDVSNFQNSSVYGQKVLIVNSAGVIVEVHDVTSGSFSWNECAEFTIYSYNYLIGSSNGNPQVGQNISVIDCSTDCCELTPLVISFEDNEAPVFTSPPGNETLSCADNISPIQNLAWTDNCAAGGSSPGIQTGSYTTCDGGVITRTWVAEDECENITEHVQTITILPVLEPAFINPPQNMVISCANIPASFDDLEYTNNMTGSCEISGNVSPVVVENVTQCGGSITVTWTFTDLCGRTINHTQTITVDPPAQAQFVNPPSSTTVSCSNIPTEADDLIITNGLTGICLIESTISPTVSGSADNCGGTISYTWEFTDPCGRTSTHTQTITVEPVEQAQFVDPPQSITVSCENIPGGGIDLVITNNQSGDCLIESTVSPTVSGSANICGGSITYTWQFTDPCGRTTTHTQTITVEPVQEADFINPPGDITVACEDLDPNAPDLAYSNNQTGSCLIEGLVSPSMAGSADQCGGTITYTWTFTDECNRTRTHTQTITVEPAIEASFVNPPGDITVSCENIPVEAPDLVVSNNLSGTCLIEDIVSPIISGSADVCGGSISYLWTFTDPCGRTVTHTQNITVEPAPVAEFIDPPVDITMDCSDEEINPQPLQFSNGGVGACLIEGEAFPLVSGNNNPCGGIITIAWETVDQCGNLISHIQNITIEPAPEPEFLNPPSDITASCEDVNTDPGNLEYSNGSNLPLCEISGTVPGVQTGSFDPICGGSLQNFWTFTDDCGRTITHTQSITVDPAPMPQFVNPPADVTLSCSEFSNYTIGEALEYTNGVNGICELSGSADPIQSGSVDICGGFINLEWTITECNQTIQHSQNITVLSTELPEFINPPADLTLSCDEFSNYNLGVELEYTNGESGNCEISGFAIAAQTGFADICGGSINLTWSVTACNQTITHSQSIIVLPTPVPEFINPPQDINLPCGEEFPAPFDLEYSNGETGICGINGSVSPSIVQSGASQTYTWQFTSPCGQTIIHVWTVTRELGPEIEFVPSSITICLGESIDLATLTIVDQNNTNPTITYHSGSPAGPGNELPSTVVQPSVNTVYYALATGNGDCTDEAAILIIVEEPPYAGEDNEISLCFGTGNVNLYEHLGPNVNLNGIWTELTNSGVDLSNPSQVNFTSVNPGQYVFRYNVSGTSVCPGDQAELIINVLEEPELELVDVECDGNFETYSVFINSNGFDVSTSSGIIIHLGGNDYQISGVDLNETVSITLTDPSSGCSKTYVINPPNCDCPDIPAPVSGGNAVICEGEPNPVLTVSVSPGNTANWYDSASGGNLLLQGSTSYQPTETAPGVYRYFVEAENIEFPECKSSVRTQITFEIRALPTVNNAILEACDESGDGFAEFNLNDARLQINPGQNLSFSFHLSYQDAENGVNPLTSPYENEVSPQQTLYVSVTNTGGCKSIAELTLIVLPYIDIQIVTNRVSCPGDQDGSATVIVTGGTGLLEYSLNNSTWSTNNTFSGLGAGNYTMYVRDEKSCSNSVPFTIDPGLMLTLAQIQFQCNNNGTPSDSDDDFYLISFTLTNNYGNTGTYSVEFNGNVYGPFNYGTSNSFTTPADGNSYTLIFTDTEFGCQLSQVSGDLNPCSTDCLLTIEELDIVCNDNGTPSDPSDDFYTISVNASAINPGAANSFIVTVNGVPRGTYVYGIGGTFTLPADGSNPVFIFTDADINQCSSNMQAGSLTSCSDLCVITATIDRMICDDMDTQNDSDDDTFVLLITVNGLNIGSSWHFEGQPLQKYNYNQSIQFGPFLIADGPFTWIIVDENDNACRIELQVTPPPPCSDPCRIEIYDLVVTECFDNQTGPIEDDDTYSVYFRVRSIEGNTSQIKVAWGVEEFGPYNYDEQIFVDKLPADGRMIQIMVEDIMNPVCRDGFEVSEDPCSSCDQDIDAGNDQLITCNDPVATLNASSSEVGTVVWSGPNGFTSNELNPEVGVKGWYYLTISFEDLCSFMDSVFVDAQDNIPLADGGPDKVLTCEIMEVILGGTGSSTGPDLVYEWTDEQGNILGNSLTLTVNTAGVYYFQVIDPVAGCASPRDRVVVTEDRTIPEAPIYTDPGEVLDCTVSSILLSTINEDYLIIEWEREGIKYNQDFLNITEAGLILLTVIDSRNGCSNTNQIRIENTVDYPIIIIDPPAPITCLDTFTLIDASRSQSGPNLVFNWYDENGNQLAETGRILRVESAGTYILTVRDTINGCENSDSVRIEISGDFPEISAGTDRNLNCDETETQLLGSIIGGGSNMSISWRTDLGQIVSGQNTLNPRVSGAGIYIMTVTNQDNGCRSVDSAEVHSSGDGPVIAGLDIDPVKCFGEANGAIFLTDVQGGTPPLQILLNNRSTDNSGYFSPLRAGTYSIAIIDANGCRTDTIVVLQEGKVLEVDLETRILVKLGDSTLLTAEVNIPENELESIQWTPAQFFSCDTCLSTFVRPISTGDYRITVRDSNGCEAFALINILVDKDYKIFVPNAFTPNGDGTNDGFTVYGDENLKLIKEARIFDRWGDLMFYKENFPPNDPMLGWDGKFEGRNASIAVYVYYFIVEMIDGTTEVLFGDVTLLTWD